MKHKYKIDNKISKRNVRKASKKIIPLHLMTHEFDKKTGTWIHRKVNDPNLPNPSK